MPPACGQAGVTLLAAMPRTFSGKAGRRRLAEQIRAARAPAMPVRRATGTAGRGTVLGLGGAGATDRIDRAVRCSPASDLNERAAVAEAAIALGLGATSICGFCLPWPVDWPANDFGASGVLSTPPWAGAEHGERAVAGEAARLGFREGW